MEGKRLSTNTCSDYSDDEISFGTRSRTTTPSLSQPSTPLRPVVEEEHVDVHSPKAMPKTGMLLDIKKLNLTPKSEIRCSLEPITLESPSCQKMIGFDDVGESTEKELLAHACEFEAIGESTKRDMIEGTFAEDFDQLFDKEVEAVKNSHNISITDLCDSITKMDLDCSMEKQHSLSKHTSPCVPGEVRTEIHNLGSLLLSEVNKNSTTVFISEEEEEELLGRSFCGQDDDPNEGNISQFDHLLEMNQEDLKNHSAKPGDIKMSEIAKYYEHKYNRSFEQVEAESVENKEVLSENVMIPEQKNLLLTDTFTPSPVTTVSPMEETVESGVYEGIGESSFLYKSLDIPQNEDSFVVLPNPASGEERLSKSHFQKIALQALHDEPKDSSLQQVTSPDKVSSDESVIVIPEPQNENTPDICEINLSQYLVDSDVIEKPEVKDVLLSQFEDNSEADLSEYLDQDENLDRQQGFKTDAVKTAGEEHSEVERHSDEVEACIKAEAEAAEAEPVTVESEPTCIEAESEPAEGEAVTVESEPICIEAESDPAEVEQVTVESEPTCIEAESDPAEVEEVTVESEPTCIEAESEAAEVEPVTVESEPTCIEAESEPAEVELATISEKTCIEAKCEAGESDPITAKDIEVESECAGDELFTDENDTTRIEAVQVNNPSFCENATIEDPSVSGPVETSADFKELPEDSPVAQTESSQTVTDLSRIEEEEDPAGGYSKTEDEEFVIMRPDFLEAEDEIDDVGPLRSRDSMSSVKSRESLGLLPPSYLANIDNDDLFIPQVNSPSVLFGEKEKNYLKRVFKAPSPMYKGQQIVMQKSKRGRADGNTPTSCRPKPFIEEQKRTPVKAVHSTASKPAEAFPNKVANSPVTSKAEKRPPTPTTTKGNTKAPRPSTLPCMAPQRVEIQGEKSTFSAFRAKVGTPVSKTPASPVSKSASVGDMKQPWIPPSPRPHMQRERTPASPRARPASPFGTPRKSKSYESSGRAMTPQRDQVMTPQRDQPKTPQRESPMTPTRTGPIQTKPRSNFKRPPVIETPPRVAAIKKKPCSTPPRCKANYASSMSTAAGTLLAENDENAAPSVAAKKQPTPRVKSGTTSTPALRNRTSISKPATPKVKSTTSKTATIPNRGLSKPSQPISESTESTKKKTANRPKLGGAAPPKIGGAVSKINTGLAGRSDMRKLADKTKVTGTKPSATPATKRPVLGSLENKTTKQEETSSRSKPAPTSTVTKSSSGDTAVSGSKTGTAAKTGIPSRSRIPAPRSRLPTKLPTRSNK